MKQASKQVLAVVMAGLLASLSILAVSATPAASAPISAPQHVAGSVASAARAAAHSTTVTAYAQSGEGVIRIMTRVCGNANGWQAVAAANNIKPSVYLVLLNQRLTITCNGTPVSKTAPAKKTPDTLPVSMGWSDPLPSSCGSHGSFGAPRDGGRRSHQGIDLGASTGTPIHAVAAGTVFQSGWISDNAGYGVEIRSAYGVVSKYFHMSRIAAHNGQTVTSGQVIGYVGATGDAKGAHLHFEIWVNGKLQNPGNFLADHGVNVYC